MNERRTFHPDDFVIDLTTPKDEVRVVNDDPVVIEKAKAPALSGKALRNALSEAVAGATRPEDLHDAVSRAAKNTNPLIVDFWESIVVPVGRAAARRITRG